MYNHNFELRHVRYFVAVARELHFRRAAEQLQMAQPPLSQQIRQLEQILGAQLFERDHHTVTLTPAGEVFLEEAERILEQVEQAFRRVQQAQQGLVGRLDIGYIKGTSAADMLLPDMLQIYRQRFPAVEIRLREMDPQEQIRAIRAHQLRVGVVATFQDLPAELDYLLLERIPLVAVFAPQHPFASQATIPIRSLINESFIVCQRQAAHVFYDRIIQLCGFSPRITQEVPDTRMLLGLVAANLGISIVPATSDAIRNQGIVYRPLTDLAGDGTIEMILVWRRKENSPLVQAFLTIAHEVLGRQRKDHSTYEKGPRASHASNR